MQLLPKVKRQVEKFIAFAKDGEKAEREAILADPKTYPGGPKVYADSERYTYSIGRNKEYVDVRAGSFYFKVHGVTGQIRPLTGRTYSYCGNIADFQRKAYWKAGLISRSTICVPILERLCICGSTRYVTSTRMGLRCVGCRGADTRHIASIRRLGGVPMLNGKPL